MKLYENIVITPEVLENIIIEECKKVPGIDVNNDLRILINDQNTVFNVEANTMDDFTNVYNLALELQKQIYYHLTRQFDATNISVNIFLNRKNQND